MRTTYAVLLAVATAALVAACGRAEAPTNPGPMAASNVNTEAVITPPATKAPEVTLPPLPSNITAPTDPKAAEATPPEQPTGTTSRDTEANNPKGELTDKQEQNEMPKANQANNHSSTALDKEQSAQ